LLPRFFFTGGDESRTPPFLYFPGPRCFSASPLTNCEAGEAVEVVWYCGSLFVLGLSRSILYSPLLLFGSPFIFFCQLTPYPGNNPRPLPPGATALGIVVVDRPFVTGTPQLTGVSPFPLFSFTSGPMVLFRFRSSVNPLCGAGYRYWRSRVSLGVFPLYRVPPSAFQRTHCYGSDPGTRCQSSTLPATLSLCRSPVLIFR